MIETHSKGRSKLHFQIKYSSHCYVKAGFIVLENEFRHQFKIQYNVFRSSNIFEFYK